MPKPPTNMTLSDSESSDENVGEASNSMDCDPTFAGSCSSSESNLLTQGDQYDIVRDFEPVKDGKLTFRIHLMRIGPCIILIFK